jgi:hypothetical protein
LSLDPLPRVLHQALKPLFVLLNAGNVIAARLSHRGSYTRTWAFPNSRRLVAKASALRRRSPDCDSVRTCRALASYPPEVQEELKTYVYRVIDLGNGETS